MNWLVITPEKLVELNTLNDAHEFQNLSYRKDVNGVMLTPDNKSGDEYWADWQSFLSSLERFVGKPQFPQFHLEA